MEETFLIKGNSENVLTELLLCYPSTTLSMEWIKEHITFFIKNLEYNP